jgi:hypothetical protein
MVLVAAVEQGRPACGSRGSVGPAPARTATVPWSSSSRWCSDCPWCSSSGTSPPSTCPLATASRCSVPACRTPVLHHRPGGRLCGRGPPRCGGGVGAGRCGAAWRPHRRAGRGMAPLPRARRERLRARQQLARQDLRDDRSGVGRSGDGARSASVRLGRHRAAAWSPTCWSPRASGLHPTRTRLAPILSGRACPSALWPSAKRSPSAGGAVATALTVLKSSGGRGPGGVEWCRPGWSEQRIWRCSFCVVMAGNGASCPAAASARVASLPTCSAVERAAASGTRRNRPRLCVVRAAGPLGRIGRYRRLLEDR